MNLLGVWLNSLVPFWLCFCEHLGIYWWPFPTTSINVDLYLLIIWISFLGFWKKRLMCEFSLSSWPESLKFKFFKFLIINLLFKSQLRRKLWVYYILLLFYRQHLLETSFKNSTKICGSRCSFHTWILYPSKFFLDNMKYHSPNNFYYLLFYLSIIFPSDPYFFLH